MCTCLINSLEPVCLIRCNLDQPAQIHCETCADDYCEVCFAAQHRKGTRKRHATKPLSNQPEKKAKLQESNTAINCTNGNAPKENGENVVGTWILDNVVHLSHLVRNIKMHVDEDFNEEPERTMEGGRSASKPSLRAGSTVDDWFLERSKFIPMRLTLSERKYLRLLEAALNVSEYTDKIDTIGFGLSKAKRIVHQIRELCAIISGLVMSADYKQGQELFASRDFQANEEFYQQIFELGRRHKIMNPDKMRSTYGKLMYLLQVSADIFILLDRMSCRLYWFQDSQTPEVKDLLNFTCVKPIKTVYAVLDEHDALDLLRDDLITIATKEIYAEGRTRRDIQKEIKAKERAIETLAARYERRNLSQEQIRQCLYSIGDNHAFLRVNRDPCDNMIAYLKQYFHPTQAKDSKGSLAIQSGRGGARLTHDHSKQYAYVIQSLTLWREVLHGAFPAAVRFALHGIK